MEATNHTKPVIGKDSIEIEFLTDQMIPGDMSSTGIKILNPRRGTTYFGLSDWKKSYPEQLREIGAKIKDAFEELAKKIDVQQKAYEKFLHDE